MEKIELKRCPNFRQVLHCFCPKDVCHTLQSIPPNRKQTTIQQLISLLQYERDKLEKAGDKSISVGLYAAESMARELLPLEEEQQIKFAKYCLDKALDLDIRTAYSGVEKYYKETYGE
jgi:hypothetical protein